MTKSNPLAGLFQRADSAPFGNYFYDSKGDVRAVRRTSPVVRSILDLKGDLLPNIEDSSGDLKRPPKGTPAVEVSKLDAAIINRSLVAQSGAKVIIYEDTAKAVSTGKLNDILMISRAAYFETYEAAPFSLVPDGQDVAVTPFPIKRAAIHADTSVERVANVNSVSADITATKTGNYMVRFEFTRAELKDYPSIEDALMHVIVNGLTRTADAVLLSAILAGTPQPPANDGTAQPNVPLSAFSLSAAAAAGARMSELRALIGTAGNGAAIDDNGVLRAAGIQAELTPEISATIVGTFARSSIMIRSDVQVTAERVSTQGKVAFTVLAAIQPLLPDLSFFWTVGAQ